MDKQSSPVKQKDKVELEDELVYNAPLKSALSESLFVLLPLIVITLVMVAKGSLPDIFKQAEWAFGATVLAGQSITKVVLALGRAKTPSHKINNIILLITAIIVFLLVPSLIVLALMLTLSPVPMNLLVLQILLFLLSLIVFFFLHTVAESFQGEEEFKRVRKRKTR